MNTQERKSEKQIGYKGFPQEEEEEEAEAEEMAPKGGGGEECEESEANGKGNPAKQQRQVSKTR